MDWGPQGRSPNGTKKENVVPRPTSESTVIRPPIDSTSPVLMDNPNPVPPNRRAVVLSACSKATKIR